MSCAAIVEAKVNEVFGVRNCEINGTIRLMHCAVCKAIEFIIGLRIDVSEN